MTEGASQQNRAVGGMSRRAASWLAWSIAGLSVVMFLASTLLWLLARGAHVPANWGVDLMLGGHLGEILFLTFPVVGALIASRHPRNPVGWICLADGLL